MSFFGNSTFGHYLHIGGQAQGFGKNGFGSNHDQSSFGSSKKGELGGFGQGSAHLDPNGLLHHGYDGQYYGHSGILRQHSLLGEMTQSKQERANGAKPWVFSSFSYPQGQRGDGVFSSLYEKPLEKTKAKLSRQTSVADQEHEPVRRAPSFASDPQRMRSKTITGESLPPRTTPRVTRSLSIVEDMTTPQNMDMAAPFLRRQQSHDTEKARRKSLRKKHTLTLPKFGKHRKSKSKESISDVNSEDSNTSRSRSSTGLSLQSAPHILQNSTSDKSTTSNSLSPPSSGAKTPSDADEKAQAKLILSLMNAEVPDDVFEQDMTPSENSLENSPRHELLPPDKSRDDIPVTVQMSQIPESQPELAQKIPLEEILSDKEPTSQNKLSPKVENVSRTHNNIEPSTFAQTQTSQLNSHSRDMLESQSSQSQPASSQANNRSPILSPTLVTKRLHKLLNEPGNDDIKSDGSEQLTPPMSKLKTDQQRSKSPTRNPVLMSLIPSVLKEQKQKGSGRPLSYTSTNDSDNSDMYFDAHQSQHSSPIPTVTETSPVRKRTVRKTRNTNSSSCTDGEDTTSTSDTPPRASYRDSHPRYKPSQHEAETLKIRHRESYHARTGKSYIENLPIFATGDDPRSTVRVIRNYVPVFKPDKDNSNEHLTVDSSESGYSTSNIPHSPKNYDPYKVSQFVNSLSFYPDMDEQRSESSHDGVVLNGSETDSDLEGVKSHDSTYEPEDWDLNKVNCHSGSDSENESIRTNDSASKMEVMKILKSPTEVRARLTNHVNKEKPREKEHSRFKDDEPKQFEKLRKNSNASQTEVLKVLQENKDENDKLGVGKNQNKHTEDGKIRTEEKKIEVKHAEVQCMVVSPDPHETVETKLIHTNDIQKPSITAAIIEKLSFRREYSTVYQTKSTNCIDALLHFLNLILFLSSAGVIGIGLWLHLKDFNINDITVILGNNLLQVITYVAISGAGVALLAAFCLCCGLRQDKPGLGFYTFVLVAVVIAFTTATVLSTIFSDKLQGIEFKVNFKDRLVTMYGIETENSVENKILTTAWDNMQKGFECCGGEGNENDTDSWSIYRRSEWFLQHENKGMIFVPESCCKKNSNIDICQGGDHNLLGPPRYAPPRNKYYPQMNPNLNTEGCYSAFSSYLGAMTTYIAITCACLAGLYFVTVMLTWVFCFKKSQDLYDDSYVEEFYDIEDDVFNSEVTENGDKDGIIASEETRLMKTSQPAPTTILNISLNKNLNDMENGLKNLRDGRNITETDRYGRRSFKTSNEDDNEEDEEEEEEDMEMSNYNSSSEESNTDSDTENYTNSNFNVTPTEDRKNIWLTSVYGARHILSVAIEEEEDSNLEDSDVEKQKSNVTVKTQL